MSTVSHELKTPLTSIRMFAEMLEQGLADGDPGRAGRYHNVIVRESQRLGLLIGTIGLRVQPWADPQQLLAGFDRESIGAIVLDVRMPGLSGLALFDKLIERGLSDTMPVIFLTGHGGVPTDVDAVKRGAFDFCE